MSYHIEYAKSDRSSCAGPKDICPAKDKTIDKGELRFGVEVPHLHGVTWRHWTCITETVVSNMKKAVSSPEEIKGFDEIREEDQERIRRTWEEGHVPDNEQPESYSEKSKDKEEKTDEKDEDKLSSKNEKRKSIDEGKQNEENKKAKTIKQAPKVSRNTPRKRVTKQPTEPTRRSPRNISRTPQEKNKQESNNVDSKKRKAGKLGTEAKKAKSNK
ncbi:uncharacterized protein BX663DRAFT_563509 [Cokeromyces recurvatus]|uniref:uncharacterized protein n=1 Tax=Cokeromyces recurvatus TaxID=90255 RepID=UPI0022200C4E|nr:uncharacterized protein BX663DRAFT_563509 [Cokeromyces recurvatus]KAI7900063.1 hypothetical protein BX663DRAFT_563509 [Cokeromyces recurvatus]